ncbi:MAG: hypothetical protein NTV45_04035 [Firmicutes bacterium]|nr:hypothetical protein [Bacillota bacterium]
MKRLQYTLIPRASELPPEAQREKEMMQAQSIQLLIIVPMFLEDKSSVSSVLILFGRKENDRSLGMLEPSLTSKLPRYSLPGLSK